MRQRAGSAWFTRPLAEYEAVRLTAEEYLEVIHATDGERRLVEEGVVAVQEYERMMLERRDGVRAAAFRGSSAEKVIEYGGLLSWRRQAQLLIAVLRASRERGVTFLYHTNHHRQTAGV